jgi:hypothetical protein
MWRMTRSCVGSYPCPLSIEALSPMLGSSGSVLPEVCTVDTPYFSSKLSLTRVSRNPSASRSVCLTPNISKLFLTMVSFSRAFGV